jgi:hypothetical protein
MVLTGVDQAKMITAAASAKVAHTIALALSIAALLPQSGKG